MFGETDVEMKILAVEFRARAGFRAAAARGKVKKALATLDKLDAKDAGR
ncbi:MAG: hypothetical protein QM601_12660 [Pseudoxanthomonas sp.]